MRKLLLIFITSLLLFTCSRQHIYHTYYRDIDIDTMEVGLYGHGYKCYKVAVESSDTIYYDPGKNEYFIVSPSNDEHGNVVARYNPEDKSRTGNY